MSGGGNLSREDKVSSVCTRRQRSNATHQQSPPRAEQSSAQLHRARGGDREGDPDEGRGGDHGEGGPVALTAHELPCCERERERVSSAPANESERARGDARRTATHTPTSETMPVHDENQKRRLVWVKAASCSCRTASEAMASERGAETGQHGQPAGAARASAECPWTRFGRGQEARRSCAGIERVGAELDCASAARARLRRGARRRDERVGRRGARSWATRARARGSRFSRATATVRTARLGRRAKA